MDKEELIRELPVEFIDIEPVNDYISQCKIRVMYHGFNRNRGYFSKAVAEEIANSLPRTPIVGKFYREIGDFGGHEEEIEINEEGLQIVKNTMPYGAVAEYEPIVWEKVLDENGEVKEYLVAVGYLWTGRYPELNSLLTNPKGQSMELFPESVKGFWAKPDNVDEEVFIYSEAAISALCILGDEVEPCYEDASISIENYNYSLNKQEFETEFNNFMKELDNALEEENNGEGGNILKNYNHSISKATTAVEKAEESKTQADLDKAKDLVSALEDGEEKEALQKRLKEIEVKDEPEADHTEDSADESDESETEDTEEVDTFSDEEEEEEEEETEVDEEEEEEEENSFEDNTDDGAEKKKLEFEALQSQFEALKADFETLKESHSILVEEKAARELEEKEAVCEQFSVLGEEVIADFKERLDDFTVEELDKELSVLAFKKGLSFNLIEENRDILITRNPDGVNNDAPAWVKAVQKKENI